MKENEVIQTWICSNGTGQLKESACVTGTGQLKESACVTGTGELKDSGCLWQGLPEGWIYVDVSKPSKIFVETDEYNIKTLGETIMEAYTEDIAGIFRPTKIIYNPPYTICYFGDEKNNDKVIVKCSEFDEFRPDFGVMACIMRRIFNKRADFERLVKSGHWQIKKENKS